MLILVGLLLIVSSVNSSPGDRSNLTIQYGKISGVEGVTDDQKITFYAYLGLPYATPPLGNLRFQPPQEVSSWSNVYDASYHRSMCTQGQDPVQGKEDCLYLNVYTTVKQTGVTKLGLPVLVWIHGGGYTGGSGDLGLHGADRLLDHGVVVVSINYRLGVFGFLSTEDSASPGNYGLKDQIAALKWINRNINSFGGDPNKVTIFGESAGASSVHFLIQSKLAKGLFSAAISDSGSSLSSWSAAQYPRLLAFKTGILNLILTLNSTDLVNRLRHVSYTQLQTSAAVITLDIRDQFNGIPWAPCIENNVDGAAVTSYSHVLLNYGDFNQVPLLTGFNSNEAREVSNLKWLVWFYQVEYSLIKETLVPKDMHAVDVSTPADKIKAYYFNNGPAKNDSNFIHYASDTLFVRPIRKTVQLYSQYAPTYFYRFSFTGGVTHKNFTPEGASHAEELQFIFNMPNTVQVTQPALLTQERMVRMWTNFAKFHNPTPIIDPVFGNVTWARSDVTHDGNLTYLDIGNDLEIHANPENEEINFWEKLYLNFGFQPYNTY